MSKTSSRRLVSALVSLRTAIVVTVVLGIAVPLGLSLYSARVELEKNYRAVLDAEVERSAGLVALAMREPLWQFAADQANSIIDAMFVDERVLAVEVFEPSGASFATRTRAAPEGELVLERRRKVEREGKVIGEVLVRLSGTGYRASLEDNIRASLVRSGITMLVSVLLIILILNLRLVRPLRELVDASSRLAAGELDTKVDRSRGDEIGVLANSLEAMRTSLAALFAELRSANAGLEERVAGRTRELEQALSTLQRAQREILEAEKLASLGRVVAGVAHELNTPIGNALTVASTVADMLRPLIEETRTGNVRRSTLNGVLATGEGLTILLRNLEKATKLISDFKQVAVDQTSEQRRRFDLGVVTEEVLNTLGPTLKKTKLNLHRGLEPGIECDSFPGLYDQVVSNLVNNAVKHGFEPGAVGNITVTVSSMGRDQARLTVSDDGVGMTEEVRQRMFEPFFTTKLGSGGSGLGLNIVQGFVSRMLGGTIRTVSSPGAGCSVIVEFPCTAPSQPAVASSHAASAAANG